MDTFKGLKFAYEAGRIGGTAPCIFNAANEVAVGAFLKGKIKFLDIYNVIEETMSLREVINNPDLPTLIAEDYAARSIAEKLCE